MNPCNERYYEKLKLYEVYSFVDMPRIFACAAPAGQKYLCINVAEDEDTADWVFVAISNDRLREAKRGAHDLRYYIMNPEDGFVYRAKSRVGGTTAVEQYSPEEMAEEYLPEPGELLPWSKTGHGLDANAAAAGARRGKRIKLRHPPRPGPR